MDGPNSKGGASRPSAAQPSEGQSAKLAVDPRRRRYKLPIPKTKNELVKEILKRWWYGLEAWPDPKADYSPLLAEKRLRVVSAAEWIVAPEVEEGRQKVLAVAAFPGVYKTSRGTVIDLRDASSKPNFANLKVKSVGELANLLKKCLKNQIRELRASGVYYERNLDYALTRFLNKFKKIYEDFLNENN